jgi:hypothetical protein
VSYIHGSLPQLETVWQQLDTLASTNPNAYDTFVKKQMESAQQCVPVRSPTLSPQPGFVLKFFDKGATEVHAARSGEQQSSKVFINVCSHEVIEPPKDTMGRSVLDDRVSADGLEFQLAVGKPREYTCACLLMRLVHACRCSSA